VIPNDKCLGLPLRQIGESSGANLESGSARSRLKPCLRALFLRQRPLNSRSPMQEEKDFMDESMRWMCTCCFEVSGCVVDFSRMLRISLISF